MNSPIFGQNSVVPIISFPLAFPPWMPSAVASPTTPPSPLLPSQSSSQQLIDNLLICALLKQLEQQHQMAAVAAESCALEQAKLAEKAAIEMALKQQQEPLTAYFDKNINNIKSRKCSMEQHQASASVNSSHSILPDNKGEEGPFLTRCGITWKHLKTVNSQPEFDDLRRRHQVSKNRHVGYGVRYACTRNAKARDNCPYLMLSMPSADGKLKVFYRNGHTHPIRHIRTRE